MDIVWGKYKKPTRAFAYTLHYFGRKGSEEVEKFQALT